MKRKILVFLVSFCFLLTISPIFAEEKIFQTPYVEIAWPPESFDTTEKTINVIGYCTDEIGIKEIGYTILYPGGGTYAETWAVEPAAQEYDFLIPLDLVEGSDANEISVYAKNLGELTGEDTIQVYYVDMGPSPFFVTPNDGELVGNPVDIWVSSDSYHHIMLTQFYYSMDGESWVLIDTDYDGIEIPDANPEDCNSAIGYGWECEWDTQDLADGTYYLRAQMWTDMEQTGFTDIQVSLDPTPPIPEFETPAYDETIQGTTPLVVYSYDENIDNTIWFAAGGDGHFRRFIENKDQHHYMNGHGPYYRDEDISDQACAPTAAAACLRFWHRLGYNTIMTEPETGRRISQSHLVEELGIFARTNSRGTTAANLSRAIRTFLARRDLDEFLEVHTFTGSTLANNQTGEMRQGQTNFSKYKEELEFDREDVIWGYNWFKRNETTGRYQWAGGHRMVGTGVDNRPANDTLGRYHNVSFMDPWTGREITVRMRDNGSFQRGNKWCHPAPMITVSPRPRDNLATLNNDWEQIGADYDPDDGWSINWDTTTVNDGVWAIRSIMTDHDGNQGEGTIVVHVDNNQPNLPPEKPSKPSGSTEGKPGIEYTYTTSTTDPNGDKISYLFSWGDETDSGWTDPTDSGETATASHSWTSQGDYEVKVKARDVSEFAESEWSDPLGVSMPRNKEFNTRFLEFLKNSYLFPILKFLLNKIVKL